MGHEKSHQADHAVGGADALAGRLAGGVQTTDDVIVDNTATGLVLKDTNGHYWRYKPSILGVLVGTDLGTSIP